MKHDFLIILFFTILSNTGFAQYQKINSRIVDAITKEPVAGAVVHNKKGEVLAIAGPQGDFEIDDLYTDSISVSCMGYQTLRLTKIPATRIILLYPSVQPLAETVVTASREGEQHTTVPVALSVISSGMIAQTHAITLDQLLNQATGVYMIDLGNEQHTMAIRQPIGYRSVYLYLENGIPIRTVGDFNHNALIEINSAAVKNIEIIRGPGSSIYGSDAIGGAINFITHNPTAIPTARLSVEGTSVGYRRAQFQLSGMKNKLGMGCYGYYAHQHDTYHQHNDFHKLAFTIRADDHIHDHLNWNNELTWINYFSDMNGGLDSLDFYQKNYASYYTFNYRKVQALRLSSGLHYDINRASTGFITAYYRYNNIEQNPTYRIKKTNDPLQARGEINKNQFNSLGLLAQHAQQWNHDQLQAIFGIQVEYSPLQYHAQYILIQKDNAGYYVSYTPTDSVLTDYAANIYNYAAYTQWKWQPIEKLYLTAGLRYDRIDYDFTNHLLPSAYTGAPSGRNGFSHLTPKIGFTYVLSSRMGGYANFSQGFAPPDITDLYNGVRVPYLKPASYLNYETGIWLRIDDDRMLCQVDVYRMLGKNEIISVRQDDGSYQNANAGKTLHEGLEYTFQYHPLQSLQIRWNGTWAYHAFIQYQINGKDYAHHRMNAAPGWIYDAAVQYQMPFLKGLQLSAEWQHVGRYYIDPANTLTYPGYDLFHVRTAYEQKRWAVWLHLLNVFNTIYATTVDYASYGNTYRAGIPRTWQIGFSYNLIQPDQSFKK